MGSCVSHAVLSADPGQLGRFHRRESRCVLQEAQCAMPRQRTYYSRRTYTFPDDFPERLERFKEESRVPWAELNRRLGVHPQTMRRWRKGRARPSMRHMMALLDLADGLGLGHIFTD